MVKNKRAWIKIVEAFMAIALILGFLILLLNLKWSQSEDYSLLEKNNLEILRGIQGNSSLRANVFSSDVGLNSSSETFPESLRSYLDSNIIPGEACYLYICDLDSGCPVEVLPEKSVYASEVLLFATSSVYSPRKLKISCMKDEI